MTESQCNTVGQSPDLGAMCARCVIVGSLQVVYRLPTGSGVTISQPQPRAAALQDSDLYVEVDKLDSYTHILPELTRLFAKGAVHPELAQFLIALTLTMVSLGPVPLSTPSCLHFWLAHPAFTSVQVNGEIIGEMPVLHVCCNFALVL